MFPDAFAAVAMTKVLSAWVSITWELFGKATVLPCSPKLSETLDLAVEPSICVYKSSMHFCCKSTSSVLDNVHSLCSVSESSGGTGNCRPAESAALVTAGVHIWM